MAKTKENEHELTKKKLSILQASFFINNVALIVGLIMEFVMIDGINFKGMAIFLLVLNGILLSTYAILNKYKHMVGNYLESDIMKKYGK